jgi:protein-disulfide isomerase
MNKSDLITALSDKEKLTAKDAMSIIKKIRQDYMDDVNAGVSGTPTLFINGRLLRNRSMEGFKEIIGQIIFVFFILTC